MKKRPKCNKMAIKSGLVGKNRLMRTWCEKCGFIIEQEDYEKDNKRGGNYRARNNT